MGQLKEEKDRSNVMQCVLMGQPEQAQCKTNVRQCVLMGQLKEWKDWSNAMGPCVTEMH